MLSVWLPGLTAGLGGSAALRENLGAGAGCTTPATVAKPARSWAWRWAGASARLSTGA